MNYNLLATIPNNHIAAFVIGMLSAFPSLMPTALSLKANPSYDLYKTAGFEDMFMTVPIFYGLLHVVLFYIVNTFFPPKFRIYWIIGFIIGLIYPSLGSILSDHAQKVYGTTSRLSLFTNAQLLYLPFYGIIINFIMSNIF